MKMLLIVALMLAVAAALALPTTSRAQGGPAKAEMKSATKSAFFAGGCFWGVEYYFNHLPGVISADSGYMGGKTENPTYREVCSGMTGHAEAVRIVYDPAKVTYEELAKLFFEIHDPTQVNGQGPDIGDQYRSAIFYNDDDERKTAQKLIDLLRAKGFKVVTKLEPAGTFWRAEEYHQDYYDHKGKTPYCHFRTKRFD